MWSVWHWIGRGSALNWQIGQRLAHWSRAGGSVDWSWIGIETVDWLVIGRLPDWRWIGGFFYWSAIGILAED